MFKQLLQIQIYVEKNDQEVEAADFRFKSLKFSQTNWSTAWSLPLYLTKNLKCSGINTHRMCEISNKVTSR